MDKTTTKTTTTVGTEYVDAPRDTGHRYMFLIFAIIFLIAALAILIIWLIGEFSNTTMAITTRERIFLIIILVIFAFSSVVMFILAAWSWKKCYYGNVGYYTTIQKSNA